MYRRTAALIDLQAIRANYELACSVTGNRQCIAVVKADAYGHGAVPVTRCLQAAGIRDFSVATLKEALAALTTAWSMLM